MITMTKTRSDLNSPQGLFSQWIVQEIQYIPLINSCVAVQDLGGFLIKFKSIPQLNHDQVNERNKNNF